MFLEMLCLKSRDWSCQPKAVTWYLDIGVMPMGQARAVGSPIEIKQRVQVLILRHALQYFQDFPYSFRFSCTDGEARPHSDVRTSASMLFQRLAHIPATLQRKVKQPDRSGKEIGTPWQDAPPTSLFIHLLQDNSWPLVGRLHAELRLSALCWPRLSMSTLCWVAMGSSEFNLCSSFQRR